MSVFKDKDVVSKIFSTLQDSVSQEKMNNNSVAVEELFIEFNSFTDFLSQQNISISEFVLLSRDKEASNFLGSLVSNFSIPTVSLLVDKVLKNNDSETIKQLFTHATSQFIKKENSLNYRVSLIDRIIEHVDKNALWDADFKNNISVTNNVFNEYLTEKGFFTLSEVVPYQIKSFNQCFSLWSNLEKLVEKEGVDTVPLDTWFLIMGTYKEFSEKMSNTKMVDFAYDFFKSKVNNPDDLLYSTKRNDNQNISEFFWNNQYVEEAIDSYQRELFQYSREEKKQNAGIISVLSPTAANDFLDNLNEKVASEKLSLAGFKDVAGRMMESYLDYMGGDLSDPVKVFSPVYKYYYLLKENGIDPSIVTLDESFKKISNAGIFDENKKNVDLKDTVLLFLDSVNNDYSVFRYADLTKKLNLMKYMIFQDMLESSDENVQFNFLVKSISNELGKSSKSEEEFLNFIIDIPLACQKEFLKDESINESIKNIIKATMFDLKMFSFNDNAKCDKLVKFILSHHEINNDLETWKIGKDSFFKRVLSVSYFSDTFISGLNSDLPLAQSFKDKSKRFRTIFSDSDVPGAKELLLQLTIDEKFKKISSEKSKLPSDVDSGEFTKVNKL